MEPALKNTYVVATADSVASLEAAVEGLMAAGFLPQGGVAVAGGVVLQAMLRVPAAPSPAVPATQKPVLVGKRGSTSPPAPVPTPSPPPQPPSWTSALPATRGELGSLRRGRSNRW